MTEEIFDIVDDNGEPTGRTAPRSEVHRIGLWHRTAHVWIYRRRGQTTEILLQKRSADKDAYPGCYDISSAGHIPAGDDYVESALRELKEELGLTALPEELTECGMRHNEYHGEFHDKPFHDCEIQKIYVLMRDIEPEDCMLQTEEVESVMWMDLDACIAAVKDGTLEHCMYEDELAMVRNAVM